MKNIFRKFIPFILILSIVTASGLTAFAETIYYYNGFSYTYINNEKVSICGIDDGITEISVPAYINGRKVVDIGNSAMMDNNILTSIELTSDTSLERIGSFAFANCANLDGEIVIPNTVSTIDTAAFQGCTSLDSVVFNATTGNVPNQCFSGCAELSNVTLNDTVTAIGYYAFSNCPNLTYIEIPKSVTSIAKSSFQNDTDITLGVYRNSYALDYAESNGINYIILDPEPTEPPTEPEPTEVPTEESTVPVTEAPTTEPTQSPTELSGYYLGDVNGDGTVDTIDTTLLQRHLASISILSEYNILHGDVDSDGITSIIDVTLISRYLAKIDVIYPVGEWQSMA